MATNGSNINSSGNKPLPVLETPFCGDLRSKKYYMTDAIITNADDYEDSSGHTWCYHTQLALGPDGNRAAPESCGPARRCYRSALAQPSTQVVMRPVETEEV